jgi:hypothetical protein
MARQLSFSQMRDALVTMHSYSNGQNWPPNNVPRVLRFSQTSGHNTGLAIVENTEIPAYVSPEMSVAPTTDVKLASNRHSPQFNLLKMSIRRTTRAPARAPIDRTPIVTMGDDPWEEHDEPYEEEEEDYNG